MLQSSSSSTSTVTTMTIIECLRMRITGYNTGNIVLTNLDQSAGTRQKRKVINSKYLPKEKHAVTAITAIRDSDKIIIGFSNASICIIDVFLKKDGTPTNSKKTITIAQAKENCPILAITILNDKSIAILLANGKIKVINFNPNLQDCKSDKNVSLDKSITPAGLPVTQNILAAAILPIQQSSDGHVIPYIYVLNASNQLICYKYNQGFSAITAELKISDNVLKIAAPAIGNNSIIFSTTGNAILQTSPFVPAQPQQVETRAINLSAGISAMAHTTSTLYIVTTNNLFATVPLIMPEGTRYNPIPSSSPSAVPNTPDLISFSDDEPKQPGYTEMPQQPPRFAAPLLPSSSAAAVAPHSGVQSPPTLYPSLPGPHQHQPSSSSASRAAPQLQGQPQQEPFDELCALIDEFDRDQQLLRSSTNPATDFDNSNL